MKIKSSNYPIYLDMFGIQKTNVKGEYVIGVDEYMPDKRVITAIMNIDKAGLKKLKKYIEKQLEK